MGARPGGSRTGLAIVEVVVLTRPFEADRGGIRLGWGGGLDVDTERGWEDDHPECDRGCMPKRGEATETI